MKFAIAAIVKNERDSIEEWIAYHRLLGADHFLIADNGSTDGTREYLLSLSDLEWLTFLSVVTPPDQPPQLIAYKKLHRVCPFDIPLITFIDADEYILPLPTGDGTATAPLSVQMDQWLHENFRNPSVSAVAMNWAIFGSSGHKFKRDGLVIERFCQRSKIDFGPNQHYKSIMRREALEYMENPHQPVLKSGRLVDALGSEVVYHSSPSLGVRKGLSNQVVWSGARINHYIVKSVEEFVQTKSPRGSATKLGREKKAAYFESHDKNDESDKLLAGYAEEVRDHMRSLAAHVSLIQHSAFEPGTGLNHRIEKALFRRKRNDIASPLKEFHLDYPAENKAVEWRDGQIVVQGWLLLSEEFSEYYDQVRIVLRPSLYSELPIPLDVKRPDVIAHFDLDQGSDSSSQLTCGFKCLLCPTGEQFSISFELGELRWPIREIVVRGAGDGAVCQVRFLEGGVGTSDFSGYALFDGQKRAGKLHLTCKGLAVWEEYLRTVDVAVGNLNAEYRLLLAPPKEAASEGDLNLLRGDECSALQVAHLSPNVVYSEQCLTQLQENTDLDSEACWSYHGVKTMLTGVLGDMGINRDAVEEVLAEGRDQSVSGDRGENEVPTGVESARMLPSFDYRDLVMYDNGLTDQGHIVVMENKGAMCKGVLLLLGGAASVALFPLVSRIFSRVVFAHSDGHWDENFARQTAPTWVIIHADASRVIAPLRTDYSLKTMISQQSRERSSSQRAFSERRIVASESADNSALWLQWDRWLLDAAGIVDSRT